MQAISLQFDRLERHYSVCVARNDPISLLDLLHTLRVWADLKSALPTAYPSLSVSNLYETCSPTGRLKRSLREKCYLLAWIPGGVTTHASCGTMLRVPQQISSAPGASVSVSVMQNEDRSLNFRHIFFADCEELNDNAEVDLDFPVRTKCTYWNWLAADAVRINYPTESGDLSYLAISREALIRRVANTMDASHPSVGMEQHNQEIDYAIRFLMEFEFGGVSVPYLLALKVAQDILTTMRDPIRSATNAA